MIVHSKLRICVLLASVAAFSFTARASAPATQAATQPAWAEPMAAVHNHFTGRKGTFAQFGDTLTLAQGYWYVIPSKHDNLNPAAQHAYDIINAYMVRQCWSYWKGPRYGNDKDKTILWAAEHIDDWLKDLNPEVALIMFGTEDMVQVPIDVYEAKLREVVRKCLDNGTVVMLSTIPPRHDMIEKAKQYNAVIKKIAAEMNLPLIDLFGEILARRPDDWDWISPQARAAAKKDPAFSTLTGWNGVHLSYSNKYYGDYSDEALKHTGYNLRNYLTLLAYCQVIETMLK